MAKSSVKEKSFRMSPRLKREVKKHIFVYSMLSVAIVHFCVFYIYVNANSFFLAFKDQHTEAWGFSNFKIFFDDLANGKNSGILLNLKNTLIYFVVGVSSTIISFILSYYMFKKVLFHKVFRFVFVLPMIVSGVVLVAVYKNLISAGGPVAILWELFTGSEAPNFMYDARYATICIVVYVIWTGLGMNTILYSGAMSRIPSAIIESAQLDGVKAYDEMWKIVMPMVAPTFGTTLILSCINALGASGPILLFSGGMYETSTISYWMYELTILNRQYGYSSALGLMLTLCSLPMFFLCRWIVSKMPDDVSF